MKNALAHLPAQKQQELKSITDAICAHPAVEALILFGSYARGDWVEDIYEEGGVRYHYQSDYDLLAIVKTRGIHKQRRLENDLKEAVYQLPYVKTPCSIIAHDAKYINARLGEGQYFFSDIKKEGVLLYSSGNVHLQEVGKKLDSEKRYQLAKEDFEHWFTSAVNFYDLVEFCITKHNYNDAAFLLHQVAERLYNAILLVFTRYKPKTHDLDTLRKLTNALDHKFIQAFPLSNAEELRLFQLLRDAYIDARYSKNYVITEQELLWLAGRVKTLQQLAEKLCLEKMQMFSKKWYKE
ncbi:MAG: hypothetical protein K0Q74_786 [Gammaproteobacteria bacterium]|jgi:HEPN domain-containing protein/predicted nucleotidyltransferase|nr:hypothetical protein [Gammaproteobacteria bacterium]